MAGPALRVSLSPFRPQQCPMHFYEAAQASDVINKTARSQVNSFPGRYVIDGRRLLKQVQEIVQLLQLLGFVINFEKSQQRKTLLTAPLHYRNLQEPSSQTILGFQHSCDSGSECKRGVDLVAGKPPELKWESSAKTKTRYSGGDRCIPPQMGGSCGRNTNRKPVVRRQTITSYQPAQVDSRHVRSQDLCSPQKKHSHAPQNGQQDSHILHEQDG